ncbi:hypothetical protein PN498_22490 [Oscillatoria sp. CS-180]|uniref:hypothetical protein n=1 Tax=Oscillatoria sp. CS-180 TaxID=3021720 RepID=UPI00232F7B22|nr:hypothetical protein [Oscillatoria sp. CS-180]MDB9528778.1 hypothetical protein [Oscillatoria sp. CS-180]
MQFSRFPNLLIDAVEATESSRDAVLSARSRSPKICSKKSALPLEPHVTSGPNMLGIDRIRYLERADIAYV